MSAEIAPRAMYSPSERGTAMVEFAIVLPMLVLLVIGGLRFGLALNQYVVLNEAVRAGTREFTLSRGVPIVSGANSQCSGTGNSEGPFTNPCTRVRAAITGLTPAPTITLKVDGVSCTSDSDCLTKLETAYLNGTTNNNLGSVTISATYPTTLWVLGVPFCNPCLMTAQTSGRVE